MNLKEKAINAYNENLKREKEAFLLKDKMKECLDIDVAVSATSIILENLEFRLSNDKDHLSVQKLCEECRRSDTNSYPVKSLVDLGKILTEKGETFKHTCTPIPENIQIDKPVDPVKIEDRWNCPNCNTLLEYEAIVCPSCGYRK